MYGLGSYVREYCMLEHESVTPAFTEVGEVNNRKLRRKKGAIMVREKIRFMGVG